MNKYLVKTPTLVVDHAPYALVDRVFVVAADPDQAKKLAVESLRERGAEYIFACMIEGTDPALELTVIEHRMEPGDSAEVVDPVAFDLHAAAKASNLAAALRESRRQVALWKMGVIALVALLLVVLWGANYALGLKAENDRGEETLMETKR